MVSITVCITQTAVAVDLHLISLAEAHCCSLLPLMTGLHFTIIDDTGRSVACLLSTMA